MSVSEMLDVELGTYQKSFYLLNDQKSILYTWTIVIFVNTEENQTQWIAQIKY